MDINNKKGNRILKDVTFEKDDHFGAFEDGIASVRIGGKWFYINREGEKIILKDEMKDGVDECLDIINGMAAVKKGDKWFLIDLEGNNILKGIMSDGVDNILEDAPFYEGIAYVSINNQELYIDRRGNIIFKSH